MKVGFVGSKYGGNEFQQDLLRDLLLAMEPCEVHHGDRVGADVQMHDICRELNIPVIIHPPAHKELRSFCEGYKKCHEPKSYISRNKDIVNDTDIVIAMPDTLSESFKSDTWSTIRYAKKYLRPLVVIMLDGTIVEKNIS
jgi:hypothetical protein